MVAEPDARLGERAVAILGVRDGQSPPTLDDQRAHLERGGLAKQKWPESVRVVADLPSNALGQGPEAPAPPAAVPPLRDRRQGR